MMRTIKYFCLALGLSVASLGFALQSPVPMLEKASSSMIGALKAHRAELKLHPEIIRQAVHQYMLPCVDVEGMSRSVLGRTAWMKASAAERAQFQKEFTNLVIRTYANPLSEYSNETIKFLPFKANATARFARVNSVIVRPQAKNIPVSYSLVAKGDAWKVFDLSVEGVSLLQSFRNQFASVLQQSDMTHLLSVMRAQAAKQGA